MAAEVAVENPPIPAGQLTEAEMSERYSHQLRAQADAWADRDPAYAKRLREAADGMQVVEVLTADGYDPKELKDLWKTDHWTAASTQRDVQDVDGNPVDWDTEGWQQIDHTARHVSEDGETWHLEGTGMLHNPETGQWLAYTWHDNGLTGGRNTIVEGRVADTVDAAASHLSADERASLGLPGNRPAPIETVEVDTRSQSELMKDLRRQLVGDDAAPDAGLEFAAKMQAMRLEAVARGAATDHKWSMTNRLTTQMEAARRGVQIAGWMGGERQWEAQGRVLKPGAEPYTIWAPVIKGNKVDNEDEATGDTTGATEDESPTSRRVTKQTADGKTLVGFRQVKVYDWTQTVRADGQPDPDWKATVSGGNQELLDRLKASSPFPIEYDHGGNTTGHAHGWTDGRKIVLDPNKSIGNQISTLAHEMTHAELDHVGRIQRGEITREQAEQEAQLGAYLVVRSLDLGEDNDKAMTETTSAYLRSWVKDGGKAVAGHKQRWKMLQDRIGPASDAAHRILTRLLSLDQKPESSPLAMAA